MMSRTVGPFAALSGVVPAVQRHGPWVGRLQLSVRFANEAETAVMYTPPALARELGKVAARAPFHSILMGGRDVLSDVAFIVDALETASMALPVLLDTDGQRPEAIATVAPHVTLFQVCVRGGEPDAIVDRISATLEAAAAAGREHALVINVGAEASDAQTLRLVERAAAASADTVLVLHPEPGAGEGASLDSRWEMLLEQASALLRDTRLLTPLAASQARR